MCKFSRYNQGKEPPRFVDGILYKCSRDGVHLTGEELNKVAPTLPYDVSLYYRPVGLVKDAKDRLAITTGGGNVQPNQ
jgi:hypothetical protein